MEAPMVYSIIIPVFNEERRIPKSIEKIFSFFNSQTVTSEILFINDGSSDKTKEILEEYQKKYHFIIVNYTQNRGKGYAIREGIRHARGDWMIFFDIDLATPLSEFTHFLQFKNDDTEIVIGSRRLGESHIQKGESILRVFLGQGFTKISNILVPGVTDFTCGFKCFKKDAAQKIFSRARIDRWGFDTELLYIAKLHDIPITQMPITWSHDTDSRVKVGKAVINTLSELAQMKLNQIRGLYK